MHRDLGRGEDPEVQNARAGTMNKNQRAKIAIASYKDSIAFMGHAKKIGSRWARRAVSRGNRDRPLAVPTLSRRIARKTPPTSRGRSCSRGLPRRFHWSARHAAVISGSSRSSPIPGRSDESSRTSVSRWSLHRCRLRVGRRPSGVSSSRPMKIAKANTSRAASIAVPTVNAPPS